MIELSENLNDLEKVLPLFLIGVDAILNGLAL
jgi:hypothetical protein